MLFKIYYTILYNNMTILYYIYNLILLFGIQIHCISLILTTLKILKNISLTIIS